MDVAQFRASLANDAPPPTASMPLQALWWQAKGDWHRAHRCCQDAHDQNGAWTHAYLHRVEGDLDNAGGWYRRAGKPASTAALDTEWQEIADTLLRG